MVVLTFEYKRGSKYESREFGIEKLLIWKCAGYDEHNWDEE